MAKLQKFPSPDGTGFNTYPAGWTLVSGEPKVSAWRQYASADGGEIAGTWRCTEGAFEVVYDKWEFCHVLEGHCRITEEGGASVDLRAGDAFVVEPGFRGRWEVVETMAKHFVFVLS